LYKRTPAKQVPNGSRRRTNKAGEHSPEGVFSASIKTELWPLDKITPYTNNPRKRSRKAVEKVAASIKEFGWRQPIVVDEKGTILAGHTRLDAARFLELSCAPVHQAIGLTTAQKNAFRIADNRTNEETQWDDDLLAVELHGLQDLGFDLSLTGFDVGQLNVHLVHGADGEDEIPPLPDTPVTRRGDLWLLGRHRVLCGDATATEATQRACAATVPFLMVTDPPYGVEYDPAWRDGKGGFSTAPVLQRGKVLNDDRADWTEAWRLFPGSVAYVWHGSLKAVESGVSLKAAGFEVRGCIIWRKQQAIFSQGHYHWQHEPCWYAVRKGKQANWHGDRKQSTVWDVQNLNPTGNRKEDRVGHGTQKPVEIMRRPILNHTVEGDAVYDPFLGSGSTLIACEEIGRTCIGIDIHPKWVDVVVQRWQKFTGKAATDENGETFDSIALNRLGPMPSGDHPASEAVA
jgi:DNA modification methylase